MKSKEKKIALFGGSFNPPHLAHRQVVDYLANLPDFDEAWVVPTYAHPFVKELIPWVHRKRMAELLIADCGPRVKLCTIEEKLGAKPSYMIDSVRALKKKHPDHVFSIVVGSDCRDDLPKWKNYQELKKEAVFFFVPRPGFEESPFMDISSTQIRGLIKEKKPVKKYLAPKVAEYIEKNGLYESLD
ncbi:MAG: nicotinate-nicotinamide nucleotide adenylyltransferase [Deltaproteobacteria bacterium]|nr:nicotinate-nicotinamide nucleotide adenylyltransferase [Deltaproteobacteria bacterium]